MTNYTMAIEFSDCDKETQKRCLFKKKYKECVNGIYNCHYPLTVNPLCLCNSVDECNHKYKIVTNKDKIYILYYCEGRCRYFVKDFESSVEKILKPLHSERIYYGKDLEKLVKVLFAKTKDKSDFDLMVSFLEKTFRAVNRRV